MILSDRSIREALESGRIVIDPLGDDSVQPSSVDLRVDRFFRVFRNHTLGHIDVKHDLSELTTLVEAADDDPFILHPGEFVLGCTLERVALPDDLVARLEGKSSLGRLGLLIHSTAGFVDAGFEGQLTLELSNVANLPITLYPGDAHRSDQLPSDVHARGAALRFGHPQVEVSEPTGAGAVPLLGELQLEASDPAAAAGAAHQLGVRADGQMEASDPAVAAGAVHQLGVRADGQMEASDPAVAAAGRTSADGALSSWPWRDRRRDGCRVAG